ncbi:MAG: hypothetical protein R6V49_10945 [Bacteroidales bacterium]
MMKKKISFGNYLLAILGIIVVAALITFGNTSCGARHHADELNKIDSLMVINDSAGILLAGVDTVRAAEARGVFAENWSQIREVVESITDIESVRAHESWPYITQYESFDRSLKKQIRKYNKMNAAQRENAKQLEDLYNSVKRNQIPEDSIKLYIDTEGLAVRELWMEADLLIPQIKRTIQTLDSLHQYSGEALEKYKLLAAGKGKTRSISSK